MLRVLLVDDEPIILSGIKYLLDWEKHGCVIAGSASSGTEALNFLENSRPDIVICDIAMPDITGIEILKKAGKEYPETVFIMLTNHEEFDLAREALRNRAVEYLLKNKLEAVDLEKALALAAAEWENRTTLSRLNRDGNVDQAGTSLPLRIEQAVLELTEYASRPFPQESAILLQHEGMLTGFALGIIFLDYSALPEQSSLSSEEILRIFRWEKEIAGRLMTSFFPKSLIFEPRPGKKEEAFRLLLMFIWDLPQGEWEIRADIFRGHLKKTSTQITRLNPVVIFSERAETAEDLETWRSRLPPLLSLENLASSRPNANLGHAEIISRTRQYIFENLERRISLQELANHAAISPGYLSTIFKKEFKQNLVDYINMIKIERACALLRQGKYRIYEISYMLGYENAYYFTRVFRHHIGLSPSEYQKKEQKIAAEKPTHDGEQY